MAKWNIQLSQTFWSERPFYTIVRHNNLQERRENVLEQKKSRDEREINLKDKFMQEWNLTEENKQFLAGTNTAENLKFWFQHLSWSYCNNCKMLITERMLPNYFKRPTLKCNKKCNCKNKIYINPTLDLIPQVLRSLSMVEIIALRPLTVHLGDYRKHQNGYRQKTNLFRVSWSEVSVVDKIELLEDENSIRRCTLAYEHLMDNSCSSYRHFVNLRDTSLQENQKINV